MKLVKILIFIVLITTNQTVFAKANSYFGENSIQPNLLEQPFEIGDENWQKEIELIINLQKNPNLEKLEQAANERKLKPETFTLYLDKNFTREDFPKLYILLDRTAQTSIGVTRYLKNHFKIIRPYVASKEVLTLISPSRGYAYPSGHTTGSFIYAYVLIEIFPDRKEELLSLANQIANNRILVGMHYPQDIAGGKKLAILTVEELMQDEEFLQDLKKAKKEIKRSNI